MLRFKIGYNNFLQQLLCAVNYPFKACLLTLYKIGVNYQEGLNVTGLKMRLQLLAAPSMYIGRIVASRLWPNQRYGRWWFSIEVYKTENAWFLYTTIYQNILNIKNICVFAIVNRSNWNLCFSLSGIHILFSLSVLMYIRFSI